MHGVLNLLKPPGMTSHDAVAQVRRATRVKRVGHTGTLDPAAAGVLPICIGQATRLVEYLQEGTKEYVAEMTFGYQTDTLDAVGVVVARGAVDAVNEGALERALGPFRGDILQTPPLYSAIKREGKKLYELARAGTLDQEAQIEPRPVRIAALALERFVAGAAPRALLRIECGGGTYVRSLVRDIGLALGSCATMTFLVRTRSAGFGLERAVTLEGFVAAPHLLTATLPEALLGCADRVFRDDEAVDNLCHGRTIGALPQASEVFGEARLEALAGPRDEPMWLPGRHGVAPAQGGTGERVLLVDRARTARVLAVPMPEAGATCYKAQKVFFAND